MKLTSPAFADGGMLLAAHTCDGAGVSPPLAVEHVPAEAKSLALLVEDPDAPKGTFVHWVVWNIPASTREIAQGTLPTGAREGVTSAGTTGYVGACPPTGTHRYIFTLFALDQLVELPASTDRDALVAAIHDHVLEQTTLTGHYRRTT